MTTESNSKLPVFLSSLPSSPLLPSKQLVCHMKYLIYWPIWKERKKPILYWPIYRRELFSTVPLLPPLLTPPPLKTAGVSQAAPSVTFFPRHCSCSSIPLPSPHVDLTYFWTFWIDNIASLIVFSQTERKILKLLFFSLFSVDNNLILVLV